MSASGSDSPPPSPGYRCLALYHASVALQRRKEELHHQAEARHSSLCAVKKLPKEELDATFERLHQLGAPNVTPRRSRRGLGETEEDSKPPPPPTPVQENPRCLALYESGVEAQRRLDRLRKEAEARRSGSGSPRKLKKDELIESCDRLHKAGAKPPTPRASSPMRGASNQSASPSARQETLYQMGKNLQTQRRLSWQERYGNTASPQRAPPAPSGRVEQLYQTAFATRDNIAKLKAKIEDEELRACTFSPAINQVDRIAQSPRPTTPHTPDQLQELLTDEGGWEEGTQEPRSHKLYRNALETRERLQHEQERRRRQDLRECTFTPRVHSTTRQPHGQDVFSALYTDAIAQRERRAREMDERWGELATGCSSQPVMQSPYHTSPVTSRYSSTPSRASEQARITPAAASPEPVPAPPPQAPSQQHQAGPASQVHGRPEIRLLGSAAVGSEGSPTSWGRSTRLDFSDAGSANYQLRPADGAPLQEVLSPLPARPELDVFNPFASALARSARTFGADPLTSTSGLPPPPLATLFATRLPPAPSL